MGVLTQFLLRRSDIVTWGAEIDPESVEYLHAHYPEFAPRLVAGDFLGMNLRERFPEGLKIIGNFPYNISSQIFFQGAGKPRPRARVRGHDPEGGRRAAGRGLPVRRSTAFCRSCCRRGTTSNTSSRWARRFSIRPRRSKSAVIRLRRNATERLGCDETLFVKVVKASFGQRRKMIRNSLKSVFGDFGGAEHPFFTRRAEQLGVAEFVELTNWVSENRR